MARPGKRGTNPSGSLSTNEVAIVLEISYPTLLKLLKNRKIPEPKRVSGVRYWTDADVKHAQVVVAAMQESRDLRKGLGV